MKKKVGIGLFGFLLIGAIFAIGFFCGIMFGSGAWGFSRITDAYVEALPTWMAIKQADRGDYVALKRGLNQRLDTDIMRLHNLISKAGNGQDADKARDLLKAINEHRQKFPPVYGPGRYATTSAGDVSRILSGYK